MRDVAAFESANVLFDEELIDEELAVSLVAGDGPGGDNDQDDEGADQPEFAPILAGLRESPKGECGDDCEQDEGDGAFGKGGEAEAYGGPKALGFVAVDAFVKGCEGEGEAEDEGGIGHHESADSDGEEVG